MDPQNSDVSQRIFIRNMMCSCSKRMVKEELTKLGITVFDVKLGEATIVYDPEKISRSQIDNMLQDLGMGLISDKDEILVEQIKQDGVNPFKEHIRFMAEWVGVDPRDAALFSLARPAQDAQTPPS